VLRGQPDRAAPFLREAIALAQARGSEPDATVLTDAMNNLALTITTSRPADPEAIALLRESVRIADAHGLTSANVVAMMQALGNQLMISGALAESEAVLREALARADRVAPDHPTRLYVLRSLSELLRTQGHDAEAARVGQAAAEGAARAWPADYPFQFAFLLTWGRALAQTDDLERALAVLTDADERAARTRPAGHPDIATVRLGLGVVHRRSGRFDRAESTLREALAILAKYPDIRHTRAHVLGELGLTLRASGRRNAGEALLAESHTIYRELLGDLHPFTVRAKARLAGAPD
jgi:tetratricopeptide (TPR) repeat protein